MTKEVIGDGNPEGTVLGSSTSELIGFYGSTNPIAQRSGAVQDAVNATSSSAVLHATAILANELRAALVAVGLIKGSS